MKYSFAKKKEAQKCFHFLFVGICVHKLGEINTCYAFCEFVNFNVCENWFWGYGAAHTLFLVGGFKLEIKAIVTDVRSEREIKNDIMRGPEYDENIICYYDMTFADGSSYIPDRSGKGNHVKNSAPVADEFKIEGEGMTFENLIKYMPLVWCAFI